MSCSAAALEELIARWREDAYDALREFHSHKRKTERESGALSSMVTNLRRAADNLEALIR